MVAAASASAEIAADRSPAEGAIPAVFDGRFCITRPQTARAHNCRRGAVLEVTFAHHHLTDRDCHEQAGACAAASASGVRRERSVR